MRIVLIGEFDRGAAEGMAIAASSLARALRDVGVETIDLSTLGTARARTIAVRCAREARRHEPDIVYYLPKSGLTNASLARLALMRRLFRRPVVLGCLQVGPSPPGLLRIIRPDAAIVPGARLAGVLQGYGVDAEAIWLGVDRTRFRPDGPRRLELWTDRPGLRVLHVGHLNRRRNLGVLTELAKSGCNCLVVASPATDPDPEVVEDLRRAGVSIFRERIDDIAAVYRAADVYVFPVEDPRGCINLPLSVLEAAACGTPVVATPFGALPDVVGELAGVTLADSDAIPTAVADSAGAERIATAVPDWQDVARAHLDVFQRVCEARRPPRLVVLLGLDGTGKSTQARLLAAEAATRGIEAVTVWARWKPLFLRPVMSAAKSATTSSSGDPVTAYARQMSLKRRLFRLSPLRRLWEWLASLDHSVQTVPRILAARRDGRLVIADRYYHDALVDMGVNFGSSAPPPRGFFRFFPKPDRVVVLDAPEEVVFERKRDVRSLAYLQQRRPLYLDLARRHGWPVVDASQTPDAVHEAVAEIVWSAS